MSLLRTSSAHRADEPLSRRVHLNDPGPSFPQFCPNQGRGGARVAPLIGRPGGRLPAIKQTPTEACSSPRGKTVWSKILLVFVAARAVGLSYYGSMVSSFINDPARWRQRAEEMRVLAEEMKDLQARAIAHRGRL
jgi:hypothetical protein